ncbi:uncharacterized protein HD556DRAFT_822913 [Suillus plorans]|uniref:Uncharacterized protein n=1 Tax=Suillus plorans TaxID=116603 RepID=A0A9P7AIF0_9AGAM|nr:uncharacterized protein HD556DRAFT_822913 [Suillus plorans]KAG1789157.1 hypothetical protein HD556DRAFT_822913 [Suillus plorans]
MSSLRRPFATALQSASYGRVTQSLPTRLSSSMSVAITTQGYEALTIPPIFDIFDAPVRLGESSALVRRTATITRIAALEQKSSNAASNFTRAQHFSSLPPPILFDGPARPAYLLPRALENRHKIRQYPSLSHNRQAHTPSSPFISTSEPVYEIFDGPSRKARYKYSTSSSQSSSRPYVCLALGISGAFGWLAMKDQLVDK